MSGSFSASTHVESIPPEVCDRVRRLIRLGRPPSDVARLTGLNVPQVMALKAPMRSAIEASRERILAGQAEGASAVRDPFAGKPDALRAYEAELKARDEAKAKATAEFAALMTPERKPNTAAISRPPARYGGPKPPPCADERAEMHATPTTEEPVTNLESARELRAEVDALHAQLADKRREALRVADELEQEATALRDAAGGVALVVKTETPPKATSKPKVAPAKPKRGQVQPHFGGVRPGTLNARIVDLLADGQPRTVGEIVAALGVPSRKLIVNAAMPKLERRGHVERVGTGLYRKAVRT